MDQEDGGRESTKTSGHCLSFKVWESDQAASDVIIVKYMK